MAIGRVIGKLAKKAVKKKGVVKERSNKTRYTTKTKTGAAKNVKKETADRYDRMAEQRTKTSAKKAAKGAAVAGGVVAAERGATTVREKREENARIDKKAAARKAAEKTSTAPKRSNTSATPPDGKVVMKAIEAGKKSKAKMDKDVKDAKAKRDAQAKIRSGEKAAKKADASRIERSAATAKGRRDARSKMNEKMTTTSYSIKSGDTLSAIARKNNTTVATLMKLNPQIKDKDKIYAGRTMKLPNK